MTRPKKDLASDPNCESTDNLDDDGEAWLVAEEEKKRALKKIKEMRPVLGTIGKGNL